MYLENMHWKEVVTANNVFQRANTLSSALAVIWYFVAKSVDVKINPGLILPNAYFLLQILQ